jgi:hypothetical protein
MAGTWIIKPCMPCRSTLLDNFGYPLVRGGNLQSPEIARNDVESLVCFCRLQSTYAAQYSPEIGYPLAGSPKGSGMSTPRFNPRDLGECSAMSTSVGSTALVTSSRKWATHHCGLRDSFWYPGRVKVCCGYNSTGFEPGTHAYLHRSAVRFPLISP